MRVADFKGKRDNIKLDRIERLSDKLAADIELCCYRFMESLDSRPIGVATLQTQVSLLVSNLSNVIALLAEPHSSELLTHGLNALANETTWAHVEFACLKSNESHGKKVKLGFHTLYKIHVNNHSTLSPSTVSLRFGTSDISGLYAASAELLLDYRRAIYKINKNNVTTSRVKDVKHGSYSILRRLIGSQVGMDLLSKHSLDAFRIHPKLLDDANRISSWQNTTLLATFLSAHDPIAHGIRKVSLFGFETDLSELYNLSKPLYYDMERYAQCLGNMPLKGRKAETIKDTLSLIQRTVIKLSNEMPKAYFQAIREDGFVALTENGSRILQVIHDSPGLGRRVFNTLKRVSDILFPNHSLPAAHFRPSNLAFDDPFKESPRYCDYAPINDLSPMLFEDLAEFLRNEVEQIDQRTYDSTTIYHHYTQFKAILVKFREQLSECQISCLKKYGLSGFERNHSSLQKHFYLLLQQAANEGTLKRKTAYTYRRSLKWMLTGNGLQVIDAYPIHFNKTARHQQRLNTDDYYSAEDCRELAYHVESLLQAKDITPLATLQLYFARVLLKTGWNLTPALNIECDDIIRVETPLNPSGNVAVVLQKARAGYRTDPYTFTDPGLSKSTIKSAASDLLYVRDNLTSTLRVAIPADSPIGSYLFIYEQYGELKRLDKHITTHITTRLKKSGCTLNFAPQRIRKGGMNHLYRQVQKNLRDYESSAKHDFKTFESHYYREDENQVRYTLNKATKLMGQYFTGKELSDDVIIITEPGNDLQHTPTGECASQGSDWDSARYNKEHKKLHKENNRQNSFCADFLSCIWCKYFRLVADPEHVWKLLSYKNYVIQDMESSMVDYDDFESQRSYIIILKERINDMLSRIDDRFPGVVDQAKKLLSQRGMHPDWEFALPSVGYSEEGSV